MGAGIQELIQIVIKPKFLKRLLNCHQYLCKPIPKIYLSYLADNYQLSKF